MRVIIDIGHPGHVHLFRPLALKMIENGDSVLFTCRHKEAEMALLKAFNFEFINFGIHYKSLFGKIFGMLKYNFKMLMVAINFKPDMFISHGSIYASHIAFLTGKRNICMEDTGNVEQVALYKPFTKHILTPSVFPDLYGKKQIKYNGYHELAYLNSDFFQPNDSIYSFLNNTERQKYVIIRFVSWQATHDIGKGGFNKNVSKRLIDYFIAKNYKIYISSEKNLPVEFDQFKINIPPHLFHQALYYADIVIGDSQTIVAEAGILGTPAIRFNDLVGTSHGYHHKELEEVFGLIYNIHTSETEKLFNTIDKLIINPNIKKEWSEKRKKLFESKIDVTKFIFNYIKNL